MKSAATASALGNGRRLGFRALMLALVTLLAAGLWAAHAMDVHGHQITGMNNQIVWGLPHVFAVFLILAASGALNAASLSSVFGRAAYQPLARLSAVLAGALLLGGLAVLILDLGRPDRLIVAMTYYNFASIFAWNVFLYTGFLLLVGVYAWFLMERRFERHSKPVGLLAFVWRLVLTTGTGSIFGFLVAREAYDAAVMAPLFVAMSFALGTAVFLIAWIAVSRGRGMCPDAGVMRSQARLLSVFLLVVLYFVAVLHLTNLYAAEHGSLVRFLLLHGTPYAAVFWIGYIALGSILPLALLWTPGFATSVPALLTAAGLVTLGGLAQLYVVIIGGQAFPLELFPGYDVSSTFFDGAIGEYAPSVYEYLLGIGGVALAASVLVVAVRVLPVMPAAHSTRATDAKA